MEAIATALIFIVAFFFMAGGPEMIEKVFKHKTEAAREHRLEAEARVEELRSRNRITLDK